MRLLNTSTYELVEFFNTNDLRYAILSHRWEQDEVTLQDFRNRTAYSKKAWGKISGCCLKAVEDGWKWAVRLLTLGLM